MATHFRSPVAALAATLCVVGAGPTERLATQEPQDYRIIMPGERLDRPPTGSWLLLEQTGHTAQLRTATPQLTTSGRCVSWAAPDGAIALVSGPRLTPGPVRVAQLSIQSEGQPPTPISSGVRQFLTPGTRVRARLGLWQLVLSVEGEPLEDLVVGGYRISITSSHRTQVVLRSEQMDVSAGAERAFWFGDLDRDGFPDLILSPGLAYLGRDVEDRSITRMLLSRPAETGNVFSSVAEAEGRRC